jgi:hypothetical protein
MRIVSSFVGRLCEEENVWIGFKTHTMIIFKIILFSIALIINSAMLINKYKKNRSKLTIYSFLLPILFIILIIKSIKELS